MRKSSPFRSVLFLCPLLLNLMGCEERPDAADALISAYQNSCPSMGRWSSSAIQQNQALSTLITQLRDSGPCAPYKDQLNLISDFSGQISNLLADDRFQKTREAEEKVQELTLALTAATNPTVQSALTSALAASQVELATAKALQRGKDTSEQSDSYLAGTARLANLMQSLLTQGNGLSLCLKTSPAASLKLASQFVSIGGSFVSPIVGAGTAVVGQLFNFAMDSIRNQPFNDAILELSSAKMPAALACGLESMSQFYCQANDAFELLTLQASQYAKPGASPNDLWRGIDLLGRRLPVLLEWARAVRNGVQPADSSNADRQNLAWQKSIQLDAQIRNVQGAINEKVPQYESATDPDLRNALAREILGSTVGNLSVSYSIGTPSVFSSFGGFNDLACKLVFGFPANSGNTSTCSSARTGGGGNLTDDEVLRNISKAFILTSFKENLAVLTQKGREKFEIEFFRNIVVDPEGLLKRAFDPIENNITPAEILVRTRNYLSDLLVARPNPDNPQQEGLVRFTLSRIDDVLKRLRDPIPLINAQGEMISRLDRTRIALERIQDIFNSLELKTGPQFFRDRVSDMIRADILLRLKHGDFPKDIEDVIRSAGLDIRERVQSAGINDLQLVQLDLNQSRALMQGQISVFTEFFGKLNAFEKAIQFLETQANNAQESAVGANRPNRQTQAKLCTLILATHAGKYPNDKIGQICSKATLSSIYPDPKGALTLKLSELQTQLQAESPQKRYCAFYRYLRAGRLSEIEVQNSVQETVMSAPLDFTPAGFHWESIGSLLLQTGQW